MVAVPFAGDPPRLGGGERRGHPVPVPEVVVREGLTDRRDAGTVAQRMAEGGVPLAVPGELRPHVAQRVVQREVAAVHQLERQRRHDCFAHRVDVDEGVVRPGLRPWLVDPAADEVDDRLTVDHDVDGRPDLAAAGEVLDERVANGFESTRTAAGDRCRRQEAPGVPVVLLRRRVATSDAVRPVESELRQRLDRGGDGGSAVGVGRGDPGLVAGHDHGDLHRGQHAVDVDLVDVAAAGGRRSARSGGRRTGSRGSPGGAGALVGATGARPSPPST